MSEQNPLKSLISNNSLNKKELADILSSYVTITKEGLIEFLPNFMKLSNRQKILTALLVIKAKSSLFDSTTDGSLPSEISEITMMPLGSVKPMVRKLFMDKIIKKNKDGYFVPNHYVSFLKNELSLGNKINK